MAAEIAAGRAALQAAEAARDDSQATQIAAPIAKSRFRQPAKRFSQPAAQLALQSLAAASRAAGKRPG